MSDDADRAEEPIEAMELESTAEWRQQKARQYPHDRRNAEAARHLLKLAREVSQLRHSALFKEYLAVYDRIADIGDPRGVFERASEYRSRIGFDYWPATGEDHLNGLLALADEESEGSIE